MGPHDRLKKEWKVRAAKFRIAAAGVCGINTHALLSYLLRNQLIPTAEAGNDADKYPDLDHKLIPCHPIIHKNHFALDMDDLEKGGPKKKMANVNTENTALCFHLKTCFEGTGWWTHAKIVAKSKDGCAAWFTLELNLQATNAIDQADIKNKANIQLFCYHGKTDRWGLTEYINAHKKYHQDQTKLHDDHGCNDFTTSREGIVSNQRDQNFIVQPPSSTDRWRCHRCSHQLRVGPAEATRFQVYS